MSNRHRKRHTPTLMSILMFMAMLTAFGDAQPLAAQSVSEPLEIQLAQSRARKGWFLGDLFGRTRKTPSEEPAAEPAPQPEQPAAEAPKPEAPAEPTRAVHQRPNLNGRSYYSMAHPTGEQSTSVLLVEKLVPADVAAGEVVEYELHVTNLSERLTLADIQIDELMDEGFSFQEAAPEALGVDGQVAKWKFDRLAPGATNVIKVKGKFAAEGEYALCARAAYDPILCSSIRALKADLLLTKQVHSDVVAPTKELTALTCNVFKYRYTIKNPGTGLAKDVVITDTLPEGVLTTSGQKEVSINVGALPAGAIRSFDVSVQASASGTYEGGAGAKSSNGLTAQADPVKAIIGQPKLVIDKKTTENSFLGRFIRTVITVRNAGDGVAAATTLKDQIPAGTELVKSTPAASPLADGSLSWSLGTLKPQDTKEFEILLRANTMGKVGGTATVSAECADPASAATETNVSGIAAILLEVVDVKDPILVGEPVQYVITVTNQGSATGTNIQITCTLDPASELASSTGATVGEVNGNKIVFKPLPALAAKAKATWTVYAKALESGDTRFQVEMQTDQIGRPVSETEATQFFE